MTPVNGVKCVEISEEKLFLNFDEAHVNVVTVMTAPRPGPGPEQACMVCIRKGSSSPYLYLN